MARKEKSESKRCAEYYKKYFPELTNKECEEKASYFKKSCNYQCIEYYQVHYPELTYEQQLEKKKELQLQKKKNNPLNLEYYKSKYPELSLEEQEKLWHSYTKQENFQCIEYYKKRYPELSLKEQQNMLKNAIEAYTSKRDESGEKNGMHHTRTSVEKRRSISPRCIEFYKRKFPELSLEEQKQKLQEYFDYNKQQVKNAIKTTNIEYYLNQGMTEDDAKIALHNRQATFTLEKCIKKYGEIEGIKRFNNRQQKWLKTLYNNFQSFGDGRSKQSKFANDIITKCCKYLNITKPKYEKYMYNKQLHKAYAYDFTYHDKIIEFQGDYWHCNPKLYDETFFNKVKQLTAKEIWEYDYNKKILAEKYNYKVLYIWEYDYNENPQREIQKCINFLNENNN